MSMSGEGDRKGHPYYIRLPRVEAVGSEWSHAGAFFYEH